MKKPLISIIITYFRKKKFIKKTIKSILNQTYKNYELVFIYDDEDKTDLKFIKNTLIDVKKKKIIVNKKNQGVAKSRNIALKNCKGLYFAFIDADDIWKKSKLEKQLKFMKKNLIDFSFTSYSVINEQDKVLRVRKVFFDAEYFKLLKSNFIGLSTVMINRNLLSKIQFPDLKTQEDYALWLKLTRTGYKLKHFNQVLSYWRDAKNSLSSNIIHKIRDAFKLYYIYEKKNIIFSIYSVLILSYNKIIKNLY
ncbi:glycosyltransferase [Candidatus Pelagibacter sp.]|nr:glycosyltransferase [Candidatus Pelagibacter sp.]